MDQIVAWQVIIIILFYFLTKWIMRAVFAVFLMQMAARLIDQIKNSLKGGENK